MKKISTVLLVLGMALGLTLAPAALAHNRAHIILPDGTCHLVGSGNSVVLPANAAAPTNSAGKLDLRPETPENEFGTSFAAEQGNSAIAKGGACPS